MTTITRDNTFFVLYGLQSSAPKTNSSTNVTKQDTCMKNKKKICGEPSDRENNPPRSNEVDQVHQENLLNFSWKQASINSILEMEYSLYKSDNPGQYKMTAMELAKLLDMEERQIIDWFQARWAKDILLGVNLDGPMI